MGNMGIGPHDVIPFRSPRRVRDSWLSENEKRPFRGTTGPRGLLSGRDLSEWAPYVHCSRPSQLGIVPGNRCRRGVVNFEGRWSVFPPHHPLCAGLRDPIPGDGRRSRRHHVEQVGTSGWEVPEVVDPAVRVDRAAKIQKERSECIGQCLRTAAGKRVSVGVASGRQHQSHRAGEWLGQIAGRVRGQAGDEGGSLLRLGRREGPVTRAAP